MADYTMAVSSITLKPGIEDLPIHDIEKALANSLKKVIEGVSKGNEILEGGGWEIVSHDITRLQSHLIITFTLRRG